MVGQAADLLLRLLPLRHVEGDPQGRRAPAELDEVRGEVQPPLLAVPAQDLELVAGGTIRPRCRARPRSRTMWRNSGCTKSQKLRVSQLGPGVARDRRGGGVHVLEAVPLVDEDRAGRRLGQGAETVLALLDRVARPRPLHRGGHVGGHVGEHLAVPLGVAAGLRVALHGQHAERVRTALQGDAQPVHRPLSQGHHLALLHQRVEHGRRGQEGLPGAQHVLRDAAPAPAGRGGLVPLVGEVLEAEAVGGRVVQRHVEVPGVHQLAEDALQAGVERRQVVPGGGGLGDPVEGRLEDLRALALRDVPDHHLDRGPVVVGQRHGRRLHRQQRAVHPHEGLLHERHGLPEGQAPEPLEELRAGVGVDEVEGRAAQDVLGDRGPRHAQARAVGEHDPPLAVHRDRVGAQLDQAAVALLALPEGLFGPGPLGDVDDQAPEPHRGPPMVPPERHRGGQHAAGAVLPDDLVVDVAGGLAGAVDGVEVGVDLPGVLLVGVVPVAHPEQLFLGIAEHPGGRVVEERQAARQVHFVVTLVDALQDLPVALLALAEGLLRALALGDVAEAPDPAHGPAAQALGDRVALEDPPVLAFEDVEALGVRLPVELVDAGHERRGVLELVQHAGHGPLVVPGFQDLGRDAPELEEALVVRCNAAAGVDDQQAVRRGLQGRLQQREGPVPCLLGPLRLGDVVDDAVEDPAALDLHGPRVHLDVPHLAGGQPVAGLEDVLLLGGGHGHPALQLRPRGEAQVGEAAQEHLVPRVAVEPAGGGVGLHDAAGPGLHEELHRQVLLEDLAMDVPTGRGARSVVHADGPHSTRCLPWAGTRGGPREGRLPARGRVGPVV